MNGSASPSQITQELLSSLCPPRDEAGHKGTFGRLLVYAGSTGRGGAAYMAASSALRSGVGLVYLLTPSELILPLMTMCPEAIGISVPDSACKTPSAHVVPLVARERLTPENWIEKYLSDKDAVLLGPGIATDRKDVRQQFSYIAENAKHLVLDAGALSILSENEDLWRSLSSRRERGLDPAVLTPHIGEFKRLDPSWENGDMASAQAFAVKNEIVLVLKSHQTNIFTSDGKWYSNRESNSGLAKGGSGDVLSGLLAGFLAQGLDAEKSAACAVGIHALAGRLCADEHGRRAMLPTMLWNYYDRCFQMLKWEEGMESDG